ncbi:MAG: GatB/YqeY domain-containing protein, partial [Candidatus Giovannonibacteria bacterium GW2011_GWB1_47_6b]
MLREKLAEDLKTAMKSADPKTVGVLRLLISAINNKAIEKRTKTGSDVLTDDEVLQTLNGEAKKRKESVEIFIKGNRADLAEKEKGELEIIQ